MYFALQQVKPVLSEGLNFARKQVKYVVLDGLYCALQQMTSVLSVWLNNA